MKKKAKNKAPFNKEEYLKKVGEEHTAWQKRLAHSVEGHLAVVIWLDECFQMIAKLDQNQREMLARDLAHRRWLQDLVIRSSPR